jgi:hypothetical protein
LVISQTLCKEGEVAKVIHRWNNSRNVRLWEEELQNRLNIATGVDLVVSELLSCGSTDDIFAGVLGGCGSCRSPLPLITDVTSLVWSRANGSFCLFASAGIDINGGDCDDGIWIRSVTNELLLVSTL